MTLHKLKRYLLFAILPMLLPLWQSCQGGTIVGDPLMPMPEFKTSGFLPYDSHPFDADNIFSPGEPVTPHLKKFELCIRNFKVQLPNGLVYSLSNEDQYFEVKPEGTAVGLMNENSFPDGPYPGVIAISTTCDNHPNKYVVENGFGRFESGLYENIWILRNIIKVDVADGVDIWVIPIDDITRRLAQAQSDSEILCALGGTNIDPALCPDFE